VRISAAWVPLDEEALTSGERALAASVSNPDRRRDWARGRAALKALLREGGEDEDTSALRFPHPRFSLAHTREVAVAAGRGREGAAGTGIDIEHSRVVRPGAERFYLDERERAWLASLAEDARPAARLRLWTVKEALYKAHLANAGSVLAHYRVEDPTLEAGRAAVRGEVGWPLRYATVGLADGFLTVAIRLAR
jgi:4'-phosphopantetheinyl transferase EntD